MSSPDLPPIPMRLHDRPLLAGLAVPWITVQTPDDRYRFGAVDADRAAKALYHRWCQICGHPQDARFMFAMRDRDLDRNLAAEAAIHPECFHYSIRACPMLAGRMDHYRASGHAELFAGIGDVLGDPEGRRAGQAAEAWHAVWARDYTVITDPVTNLLAALLLPDQILRVRSIAHTDSRALLPGQSAPGQAIH